MKRRYVDTRHGQLHVTDSSTADSATADGGGSTVLLMHWVPLSGRMYEHELPHFAAAGVRALAVDLMGFGRSDPRKGPVWSVPQHADVLEDLLRELGAQSVTVMGGHYSTPVAVELAQRERIAGSDVRRLACTSRWLGERLTFQPRPYSFNGYYAQADALVAGARPPFDFLPVYKP